MAEQDVTSMISKIMEKKHGSSYYQGEAPNLDRFYTGLVGLDKIMGGGLPCGRSVELFADASGGKTTTAIFIMNTLLKQGYDVVYNDLERTVDNNRLKALGVEGKNFHYNRPTSGSEAMQVLLDTVHAGAKLVIMDSVPFLGTDAFYEAEPGQQVIAPQATFLSRNQHLIVGALEQNNATCLFINQTRNKVGSYGNPVGSSGGQALKFMCSIRIQLNRAGMLNDGKGYLIKYKTEKNKTGPEKVTSLAELHYETGIDPYSSMRETLVEEGLVYNKGAYFYFAEELANQFNLSTNKIGQGKSNVTKFFKENPEIYNFLYEKVLSNAD